MNSILDKWKPFLWSLHDQHLGVELFCLDYCPEIVDQIWNSIVEAYLVVTLQDIRIWEFRGKVRMRINIIPWKTILFFKFQTFWNKLFSKIWNMRNSRKFQAMYLNIVVKVRRASPCPRCSPIETFIKNDAKAPNVAFVRVFLSI